jgi:hypothetical protein
MRMKKQALQLAVLCIGMAFAATHAMAQSQIKVKVPFDFSISDETFPSGLYSMGSSHGQLTVQDSAGKTVFLGMANQVSGRRVGRTGMVVFHCYDGGCFLSELWAPAREGGSQLVRSRSEAAMARYREPREFALLEQPRPH